MLVVDPPVPCPSELDRCTGTWAHWRNVVQPRNIDSFKYCLGWQFQIFLCMFSYPDLTQDYVWDGSNCLSPNWPAVSASTIWVNAWQATALQWIWGISRHWLLYMLFYTLGDSQNSGTPNHWLTPEGQITWKNVSFPHWKPHICEGLKYSTVSLEAMDLLELGDGYYQ